MLFVTKPGHVPCGSYFGCGLSCDTSRTLHSRQTSVGNVHRAAVDDHGLVRRNFCGELYAAGISRSRLPLRTSVGNCPVFVASRRAYGRCGADSGRGLRSTAINRRRRYRWGSLHVGDRPHHGCIRAPLLDSFGRERKAYFCLPRCYSSRSDG